MERSGTLAEPSDNSTTPYIKKRPTLLGQPLSFQLVVKLLRCGINGNELHGKYYFSFSQVPHALLTRFRHNPRFSKVRRRCGRGRHGRPWPCEWDVGREPDRDERSEPPTATPPIGLVKKQCKRIPPLHITGRCHICFCNGLIHRGL